MRICILSRDNVPLGFMDNDVPNALHFYDDKLHVFMKGSAHTFEFSAVADHEDACLLEVGNKLSFYYKNTPYYLNIMVTEQTETEIKVEAKYSRYKDGNNHFDHFHNDKCTNDITK